MVTGNVSDSGDDGSSLPERENGNDVVLTSVYRGLLHASRSCGVIVTEQLWEVGKQHRDVEYIDRAHFLRLWEELVDERDPTLGLRLGLAFDVQFFGAVGALLHCCPDLRSALIAFEDFASMVREPSSMHVGIDGDVLPIIEDSEYPHWHLRSLIAVGATIHLVSEVTGHQVRTPMHVALACSPKGPLDRYVELIGCPVEFEQTQQAIVFSRAQGATELIYADPVLERRLRRVAAQTLASRSHGSVHASVRDIIVEAPHLSREQVAGRLGISCRTMQRLLEAEGLSFVLVSSAVRERLARAALHETHNTLAEVATYLGFADESSFSRAFKRWVGASPGEFRERARGKRDG